MISTIITKLTNYITEKIKLDFLKLRALLIAIAIWHTIIKKTQSDLNKCTFERKKY